MSRSCVHDFFVCSRRIIMCTWKFYHVQQRNIDLMLTVVILSQSEKQKQKKTGIFKENKPIYRIKKVWEKVSKNSSHSITVKWKVVQRNTKTSDVLDEIRGRSLVVSEDPLSIVWKFTVHQTPCLLNGTLYHTGDMNNTSPSSGSLISTPSSKSLTSPSFREGVSNRRVFLLYGNITVD